VIPVTNEYIEEREKVEISGGKWARVYIKSGRRNRWIRASTR